MSGVDSPPSCYDDIGLDDLSEDLRKVVRAYIGSLDAHLKTGQGLLLYGEAGVGKTAAACVIQRAAQEKVRTAFLPMAAYSKLLFSALDTMAKINKSEVGAANDLIDRHDRLTERLEGYRKIPLLVLDDVGKEHATNSRYIEDEFDYLLRMRFTSRSVPTIMTSNQPPEQWAYRYSASMASFIQEACPPFEVTNSDLRTKRRRRK